MVKKPVLGRGLSALLGEVAEEVIITPAGQTVVGNDRLAAQAGMVKSFASNNMAQNNIAGTIGNAGADMGKKYREMAIGIIHPNPHQPRKMFDSAKLQELVDSLKSRGVIQPLLVRPHPKTLGHYELVAGERRWRAAQLAGLHHIPVVVREVDNASSLELALIENLHRDDLNPIESAEAFQRLLDEFNHSHESLANILGKSRSTLTNDLRLLTLPKGVRELIAIGKLSAAHGRNLVGVAAAETLANKVLSEQWSVRRLEQEVKQWKDGGKQTPSRGQASRDAQVGDVEHRLGKLLGLKTNLKVRRVGAEQVGQLTIHFQNSAQLQKVINLLMKR